MIVANCTYQLTVGFGLASTMHSNLTVSSLLTGPTVSGILTKTGPPLNVRINILHN